MVAHVKMDRMIFSVLAQQDGQARDVKILLTSVRGKIHVPHQLIVQIYSMITIVGKLHLICMPNLGALCFIGLCF